MMAIEKFTYSSPGKAYRRKTFTLFQKLILYSIWIFVCAGTILVILNQGTETSNKGLFIFLLILPTFLGLALTIYIGLTPKGPEADFYMPAVEIDPADSSYVIGQVFTKDNRKLEVEVLVPNVYSSSSNLLEDAGTPGSSGFAYEEMFEFALEEVERKYPGSKWDETPRIKQS